MTAQTISVILPAYNEESTIANCIRETSRALAAFDHEIIVVDDGSQDCTLEQARLAAFDNSCVQIITHRPNRGKGYALKQGFTHTRGDLIAFLDSDADLPPRQIGVLLQVMQETEADLVVGSKLHPKSDIHYPWHRRLISWGYYRLVHFLFGLPVHDTQTGIKLFRRQVLQHIFPHLQIEGYAFDLELLVGTHLYGYSIAEAPVVLEFKPDDARPLNLLRASLSMTWDTLRVFYWASFWKWLNPGLELKFWGIVLLAGIVAGSIGLARLLNNFGMPPPLDQIIDLLLLRFLDRTMRDVVLFLGGAAVIAVAAIQLNKQIVSAFARHDRQDFWGQVGSGKRRDDDAQ
jgi:glycosyltransferase involved in cell wall biosynthesis